MGTTVYLLLTTAVLLCTETRAVMFPDDATTCRFIMGVHKRCNISINAADKTLFMEHGLQEVAEQCDVSDPTRLRNLRIDVLTYVSITSQCGVVFDDLDEMKIPPEILTEALSKLLAWPSAIPTMNCMQVQRFLAYVYKNLLEFHLSLDKILDLLKSLDTDNLSHILAVLPGQLCSIAVRANIQIYDPAQIPNLVDALASNCHSRTILSSAATCSWKDSPNPAVNAMALTRTAGGGADTPSVCLPDGAGARCLVDAPCVKLLCTIDIGLRGCNSPCPKPASMACERNGTDRCLGRKTEVMSVSLPDPADATAESLQPYVCCLLRYPRRELKYSDEVLCNLQPPKGTGCLQAFTRWQIVHAPKCLNCSASSHFAALLSPRCRQEAVKMYPTTVAEVKALIMAMTGRRNVLLQLFNHLYKSLDLPLVEIVCIKQFMRVVNVENFKKLGIDELEPVLEAMAMCAESPATAKVLAILVKGGTCPFFILQREGHDLVRRGAITDKCLESMSTEEALSVCSILMMDRTPRIPRSKIALLCKVLENFDGDTTCIFCKSRAAERGNSTAVSPKVQIARCLRLRLLARTALTRPQREEIKLCKPCLDDDDETSSGTTGGDSRPTRRPAVTEADVDPRPWCEADFQISSIEEVVEVLGDLCDIVAMARDDSSVCPSLKCFFDKAVQFYNENSDSIEDEQSEYSVLRSLRLFLTSTDRTRVATEELRGLGCARVCPFVKEAYKQYLLSLRGSRGKRDVCYAAEVIEGFSQVEDGAALTDVLEADELSCLQPEETRDIVRSRNLHMEDWTPAQARVLLDKVLQALGKQLGELTATELRELGLILITLSPEEIAQLLHMDSTTFAVCGSSTLWTKEQHRALVQNYLRQEGRSASQITEDDLFILQNLINGFTKQEAMSFPTAAVSGASAILGELRLCDFHLVSAFISHLRKAHGDPGQWDESQLAEYSHLLGGLTADEWNAKGITILAHVPDHVWRYHVTENKYNEFESHIRELITERQVELIKETGDCSAKHDPNTAVSDSGASSGPRVLWGLPVAVLLAVYTRY